MIWYKLSLGDHSFNKITQNEFDPYPSELAIYQIQITMVYVIFPLRVFILLIS